MKNSMAAKIGCLPKEHPQLPECYGMIITYLTGGTEELEVAQHSLVPELQILELATTDDEWMTIPLSSIQKMSFDSRFSKIITLQQKKLLKEKEQKEKKESLSPPQDAPKTKSPKRRQG